jgi:hypothetical protein
MINDVSNQSILFKTLLHRFVPLTKGDSRCSRQGVFCFPLLPFYTSTLLLLISFRSSRSTVLTFFFFGLCSLVLFYSLLTIFLRVPSSVIVTSISSPFSMGPTPAGVPVAIMSPGCRVIYFDISAMISGTLYSMSSVFPC